MRIVHSHLTYNVTTIFHSHLTYNVTTIFQSHLPLTYNVTTISLYILYISVCISEFFKCEMIPNFGHLTFTDDFFPNSILNVAVCVSAITVHVET